MPNSRFALHGLRPSLIHGLCAFFASNSRFMRLFQVALDTPLDSPFSATLSVHGLHFTVWRAFELGNFQGVSLCLRGFFSLSKGGIGNLLEALCNTAKSVSEQQLERLPKTMTFHDFHVLALEMYTLWFRPTPIPTPLLQSLLLPLLIELEKAVAVSGVCSEVPEAYSGKMSESFRRNFPKCRNVSNSQTSDTGTGKPGANFGSTLPWTLSQPSVRGDF